MKLSLELPPGATWHALVADDDDDTRTLIAGALRRAGFDVRESCNGEELVDCFAALATGNGTKLESGHTIVVSDIGMPKCDGIEATIAVKKLVPGTPVLLVTAFNDSITLGDARDAGADQVMQKPLNLVVLVRAALELTARAQG